MDKTDENNLKEKSDNNKKDSRLSKISQDLIDQLNDSSNELFMALPFDSNESNKEETKTEDSNNEIIDHIKSFNYKPKDIKDYLDRFIISQDEAKKALSIAICDHYNIAKEQLNSTNPIKYNKQNILMIGPTGVGKTYLIKQIADLIGVPFVKSDATKFTETGYQGGDVEDLVRQLYKKSNNNLKLAEFGIVYLDEIDKITGTQSSHHKDVSGRGVQTNLLKIMEETEVQISPPWDIQAQIKQMMGGKSKKSQDEIINTKNILFIMSGAFNNLNDIIQKRLSGATIGFERTQNKIIKEADLLNSLRTQDLIKFGLEPEFAGRMPVRVCLEQLSENDLYEILKDSEGSVLTQYIKSFGRYNIDLSFSDNALRSVAILAKKEAIGARALSSTLEAIFRHYKFELPSTNTRFVFADKDLINSPEKKLQEYLTKPKDAFKKGLNDYLKFKLNQSNVDKDLSKVEKRLTLMNSKSTLKIINDYIKEKHD